MNFNDIAAMLRANGVEITEILDDRDIEFDSVMVHGSAQRHNILVAADGSVSLTTVEVVPHSGRGNIFGIMQALKGVPLGKTLSAMSPHRVNMDDVALSVVVPGKPWTTPQVKSLGKLLAAVSILRGWDPLRPPIIGSKEFSRERSNDPYMAMDLIRRLVNSEVKYLARNYQEVETEEVETEEAAAEVETEEVETEEAAVSLEAVDPPERRTRKKKDE